MWVSGPDHLGSSGKTQDASLPINACAAELTEGTFSPSPTRQACGRARVTCSLHPARRRHDVLGQQGTRPRELGHHRVGL